MTGLKTPLVRMTGSDKKIGRQTTAKKILIVDDDFDFTDLLKSTLEETERYEVRVENHGSQGLAAAREFGPDLILLDVMMPDMEGPEVAEQIRDDQKIGKTPIVFLTSIVSREETKARSGVIGGPNFIAKSEDLHEVVNRIEAIASKQNKGTAPRR